MTSEKIVLGDQRIGIKAQKDGYITMINNHNIKRILSAAGCPRDHLGGMTLHRKVGEFVHSGTTLYTIYTSSDSKLSAALQVARVHNPFTIEGMIISRISSITEKNI